MQASSSRYLEQGSKESDWPTWSGSRKDLPNMIVTLSIRPAAEFRAFYQVLMKIIWALRTALKMMALAVIVLTAGPAAAQEQLRIPPSWDPLRLAVV
jgi:preprotein translocase subunit SecE